VIRRFNYTGRKPIDRADARLFVVESPLRFEAALQLDGYGLPADARVFVEAYRQTTWVRFDFGTVAALRAPDDCTLAAFETSDGLLFRVKVTAATGAVGRLLAEADQLPPLNRSDDAEEPREPLLTVTGQDLGQEIFRVDFTGARPMLLMNRAVGDWRALARSPSFACLIYPQVVREILTRVLHIEGHYELEPESDWKAQWLRFASQIPGGSEPPDSKPEEHELDDWIDSIVAAFGRLHHCADQFNHSWHEGAGA
jgi:hypothetical protein